MSMPVCMRICPGECVSVGMRLCMYMCMCVCAQVYMFCVFIFCVSSSLGVTRKTHTTSSIALLNCLRTMYISHIILVCVMFMEVLFFLH